MESTYGGHEDVQPTRNDAEKKLVKTIYSTLEQKGKILIPVFAVGRAQELMIVLDEYIRHGIIDEVPVYIDGMIWSHPIHTAYRVLSKYSGTDITSGPQPPFISKFS
jgi:predicted metal-dependent RNase